MTHYERLGVEPSATQAEVRHAYLRLARDHHPDHHAAAPPAARADAERHMQELNEAWRVLGDPDRRRTYDASLARRPRPAVVDPHDEWRWQPIDTEPDFVDDRLDDSGRPAPRGGRLLAVAPPTILLAGVVGAVLGLALGWRALVALGAAAVIMGMALFVLASISVVFESRHNDLDAGRR